MSGKYKITESQRKLLAHMNRALLGFYEDPSTGWYFWAGIRESMNINTATANALIKKGFIERKSHDNRFYVSEAGRQALLNL